MQTLTELPTTTLYYREGSSDKVYQCQIESAGERFVVNFAYGRRGSTMNTGTKTNVPVDFDSAQRIKARITRDGIFLEKLETNPAQFLPEPSGPVDDAVRINLNRPMNEIREILSKYPISTRLLLTGDIVVGRDIAHAKLKERLDQGEDLPEYFKNHIVYYAGPAKTPKGRASGSFGPTTAGRMDPYVPLLQARGGSMIMLAKGNRTQQVTDSCKKYGGFYLGSIGGPAARLGRDCITCIETLEYPELGMEAIFKITVKDFPAFIIVDDKGNDFFSELMK